MKPNQAHLTAPTNGKVSSPFAPCRCVEAPIYEMTSLLQDEGAVFVEQLYHICKSLNDRLPISGGLLLNPSLHHSLTPVPMRRLMVRQAHHARVKHNMTC